MVYDLEYLCSQQYVDRTKRPIRKHIAQHIQNILLGFKPHSVSAQFGYFTIDTLQVSSLGELTGSLPFGEDQIE